MHLWQKKTSVSLSEDIITLSEDEMFLRLKNIHNIGKTPLRLSVHPTLKLLQNTLLSIFFNHKRI